MLRDAPNGALSHFLRKCALPTQADISMLQVAGIKDELLGPACPWLQVGSVHGSGVGYFKLQPGGSQTDAPVDQTGVQVSSLPQTDFSQLLEVDQMTGRALAAQGQPTFRPGAEGLLGETQAAPLRQAHHAAFGSHRHRALQCPAGLPVL